MKILASRRMKTLIIIIGLAILSCTEMETANNRLIQKETQSPTVCNDYVLHESGLLVLSCPELGKRTVLEKQKEMQLPPICMNFVVDETLALSDNQFATAEYKECKTIVLEKLRDRTKEWKN